jgi:putative flippase GtrA
LSLPSEPPIGERPLSERLWTLFHESWKYFLVSAVSLAVDLALYGALVKMLGVNYLAANVVSVSAGLVVNYALSVTLVFKQRRLKSRRAEFVGFVLIGVAGLAVNEAFVALFVGIVHLGPLLGKVAAAGLSFVFNFVSRRVLLFSGGR